jgi:hypothetical protein
MLEKTKGAFKNGQSRDLGQNEDKQNKKPQHRKPKRLATRTLQKLGVNPGAHEG